jgi:5-methylcytosine-specific restriction enzyme subunit McrC
VKIPIKNLFYLLCYAWDVFEAGEAMEVGITEAPDLENLIASTLILRLERLLKRGLERDYQECREDSGCIRGRIDFQDTAKRALRRRGVAHIVFDELSSNTLANRILKSTIGTLLKFDTLVRKNRDELAGLYRGMRDVSDIRVLPDSFYRVRLHRNNQDYRLLLSVCEMVQRYVLPSEHGRGMRFVSFDEGQMWKLFQLFVENFYRRRQGTYKVHSAKLPWCISQGPRTQQFFIPGLETDIVLSNHKSRIVVDTKFYAVPFDTRFDKPTVKAEHLNQMFAYMQNLAASEEKGRRIDGILLYATVSIPVMQDWELFGHSLRVAGVDLSQDCREIHNRLLSVIGVSIPLDQWANAS